MDNFIIEVTNEIWYNNSLSDVKIIGYLATQAIAVKIIFVIMLTNILTI
jgi:hypothetical protein